MRFIFFVFHDLTEFPKVYPANLLISQYKMHNTSTQIKTAKCLFEHEIMKFYATIFFCYTVLIPFLVCFRLDFWTVLDTYHYIHNDIMGYIKQKICILS